VKRRRLIIAALILAHALMGNNKYSVKTKRTLIISRTQRNTK